MKVLIYGIGVLGSTLLHELCKAGHDVTGVARSQYDQFIKNGVKILHYYQRKTTIDHPKIVKSVDSNEHFDIVFSVMQATQQKGVLDALAAVNTSLVVLVGNNLESEQMEQSLEKLENLLRARKITPKIITGHTGWTDSLDFAFAHRDKVCVSWRKQKPHDPVAPYDAYDESDDTEEKAKTVKLEKKKQLTHIDV